MKSTFILLVALTALAFGNTVTAQSAPPFWKEVLAFKKQDSIQPPPAHPILLIGSSSFTRWTDVQSYFQGLPLLNRAFGGSTLPDVIRYCYDAVFPYQPKQVLIYCGENDLASSDSISADAVLLRVKTLFGLIRTNLPDARISYVSIKPSPVRASIQGKVRAANALIRKFIRKQKNADFINVYDAMLDEQGKMREGLYVGDRLHMTAAGYQIWQKLIEPYLVR